jgi:hypothetical protein
LAVTQTNQVRIPKAPQMIVEAAPLIAIRFNVGEKVRVVRSVSFQGGQDSPAIGAVERSYRIASGHEP